MRPARSGRCPVRDGEAEKTCLREAIDDHAAELATLEDKNGGSAARLRFRSRKKMDVNPNVDIHATYVEFDGPQTPARLFNEQVLKPRPTIAFRKRSTRRPPNAWQDTIDVRTIYSSPRLIAVKFAEWAHAAVPLIGGFYTVNIDAANGAVLVPERWFHLDQVAAACWYQFVDGDKGGEPFRLIYPLREAIDRFSENLRRPSIWSFSHRGVELQFSALMGYASGPYTCRPGIYRAREDHRRRLPASALILPCAQRGEVSASYADGGVMVSNATGSRGSLRRGLPRHFPAALRAGGI